MAILAGAKFGPYDVIAPLGSGGMGEVFRARDSRLNRTVVIKIFPSDLAANPGRLRRFEQEARTASSLSRCSS